jgi:DNA-binding MarR family transcriptional regulator
LSIKKQRNQTIGELNTAVRESQTATDAFDDAVSQALDLNRTDMRLLDIIDREGRTTPTRLSELGGLSSGAITTALDRLETAGYVRRTRDDADRRRVFVEATPAVEEISREVYGGVAAAAAELYAGYSDEELELILEFIRRSTELSTRERRKLEERYGKSSGRNR